MRKVNWAAPMKPQRGVVGAPPPVFWWTFKVYAKLTGGNVVYNEGPQGHTLSQGLARLLALGQLYGTNYVVCGTYLGGYGGSSTYCTYDGGLSTKYGSPPVFPSAPPVPAATPFFPILTRRVPVVPYSPFFGPVAPAPFPIFQGYRTTRITWVSPSPMRFLFGPKRKPNWVGRRPGGLGDACSDLNNAVASAKAARAGLAQSLSAVNNAYNNAVQSGDQNAIADLYATKQGIQADIAEADAKIVAYEAQAKAACAPPNPQPQCQNDHPDCGAAGFICVNGDCVPGCRNDGDCSSESRCVNGYCEKKPATSSSGSSGLGGLLLLAAGAAAAIFIGLKPPALPKTAAGRLQQNRRRRGRPRRRAAA